MSRKNPWANPEDAERMRAGMRLAWKQRKRADDHSVARQDDGHALTQHTATVDRRRRKKGAKP